MALLLISATAHAGKYSDGVLLQQVCEGDGDLAKSAYEFKDRGMDYEQVAANFDKSSKSIKDTIFKGYHAKSANSAYMAAWAACMDKYE